MVKVDVLKLEQNQNGEYYIPLTMFSANLVFDLEKNVLEAQLSLGEQQKLRNIAFFNKEGIEYSVTTPIINIVSQDFYLSIGSFTYFVLSQHSLLPQDSEIGIDELSLQQVLGQMGQTSFQNMMMRKYFSNVYHELQKTSQE